MKPYCQRSVSICLCSFQIPWLLLHQYSETVQIWDSGSFLYLQIASGNQAHSQDFQRVGYIDVQRVCMHAQVYKTGGVCMHSVPESF